jgi:dihydrodipicolinate synthase/N-acetylneuraminate lyase
MSDRGLTGCGTALATPFTPGGDIDERALRGFVDWQIDEGIDFVVPCGSTGEAATMTPAEHRRVVEITVEQARGRVPVCAGAGSRTGSNIEAATTLELAKHPRIIAVKEASANLAQISDCIVGKPKDFAVLSGDDELTLPILALGGDGLVSVVSNVVPKLMTELVRLGRAGRIEEARALHARLLPWMRAAFIESNPIPVKAALAMMGKMENVLRSPLVTMDAKKNDAVSAALKTAGAL